MSIATPTTPTPSAPSRPRPEPRLRRARRIEQRLSHYGLIEAENRSPVPPLPGRAQRLDAIVVPAARRAQHLQTAAAMAAQTEAWLVVLASHHCRHEEVARLVEKTPGCRALIVPVAPDYTHPALTFATSSHSDWPRLNADRDSNLSLKRNLGLLLARLNGWGKILFLDDDISGVTPAALLRIAAMLEHRRVAAMELPRFPDNSVVCHARRAVGARQDVFVSGAVLGVNCRQPLPGMFPDIYNEDWFFFADEVSQGRVRFAGEATQVAFDPYADPRRAAQEEFGDLLAEGLFSLFHDGLDATYATAAYWSDFIDFRATLIAATSKAFEARDDNEAYLAVAALAAAQDQLGKIKPENCREFLQAWQDDRQRFAVTAAALPRVACPAEAFDQLELRTAYETSFGGVTTVSGIAGSNGVSSLSRSSSLVASPGIGWRSPVSRNPIRS